MISKLLTVIIFLLTSALAILATAVWSLLIIITALIKLFIPIPAFSALCSRFCNTIMWCWCFSLALILRITNRHISWNIDGLSGLSKNNWYLLISNHQSWADVVILCAVLRNTIPVNKFFLKYQLLWVPFLGLACWGLDMPFMRRHSRAFLLKNPHLRDQDIETTRKSCEKFRSIPTTIVNFVEGSRFTEEKRQQINSPYKHLLAPKTAGIAITLNVLGKQFDKLLNVTLFYPDNKATPFLDILCGRMKRIIIRIETLPITDQMRGDYFNDKAYKRQFQLWLNTIWAQKDSLIDSLKNQYTKQ